MRVIAYGQPVAVDITISVHKSLATKAELELGYAAHLPISVVQVTPADVFKRGLDPHALVFMAVYHNLQRLKRLKDRRDARLADDEEVDDWEDDPKSNRPSRKIERIQAWTDGATNLILRKAELLPTLEALPNAVFEKEILRRMKDLADDFFLAGDQYATPEWVAEQVKPHFDFANQQLEKVLVRLQNYVNCSAPQVDTEFLEFMHILADIRAELSGIRKTLRERIRRSLRLFYDKPELSKVLVRMAYHSGPLDPVKLYYYPFHSNRAMLIFRPADAESSGTKLPLWLDLAEAVFARAFMRKHGGPAFQKADFDASVDDNMSAYQRTATKWLIARQTGPNTKFCKVDASLFGPEVERVPVSAYHSGGGAPARERSEFLERLRLYGIKGEMVAISQPYTSKHNDTLRHGAAAVRFTVPFGSPIQALIVFAE